jgi:triphosphatase
MRRHGPAERSRAQPREIELKLAVTAEQLPSLQERLGRFAGGETLAVDNVYYDTADGLLRAHAMALRVRRIGGRWVQTLKTESRAGALSSRGEWEVPAPRGRLDPLRFPPTPLAALLQARPDALLRPVFRTRFSRTVWNADDGAVEIALDRGEIVAGGASAPILELELELQSGDADALYRLALDLAGTGEHALSLRPAVDSKAVRGYRLAAGETPAPLKANARAFAAGLSRRTSLAAALRAVVDRGTTLLLANVAGFETQSDPEFIHQARVAVRRLRSAARLIGGDAGWPEALDGELKRVGRRLGAVRDWDVLQTQTLPALAAQRPEIAGPLVAAAAAARRRDEGTLRKLLAGARFARLALRLLQWTATPARNGSTLASSAARRLAKLRQRLFDDAAFFVALPLPQQHRVRIRAKRLRYALDLYATTLPAKATARWVEQLAWLQEELGLLNDAAVAAELLPGISRRAGVDVAPALEWLDRRRQQQALRAEAALAQLLPLPPPWA